MLWASIILNNLLTSAWATYNLLGEHRFGFQGMRKGNQLYEDSNLYETPFHNYDPRLGRHLERAYD